VLDSVVWKPTFIYHIGELFTYFDLAYRPIKRISAHARREKSIRHGHISTLHIWWARRPLAACRSIICATLWPDPVDELCPNTFRNIARAEMGKWTENRRLKLLGPESQNHFDKYQKQPTLLNDNMEVRNALLDFIADFANWNNCTNPEFLETSRTLTKAAHESLGGLPGTKPLVVDPFAGGGSIPLEALRVGADAFASDINPVAVLLNKVILEYIPKYGQQLADEVRKWGQWVKECAEQELSEFYPKDSDGAKPIAYLWARTVICEGPNCGAEIPLIRSLWLSKKGENRTALQIIADQNSKKISFKIIQKPSRVSEGTVKNGAAICPCCGFIVSNPVVREQLTNRNGGAADARLYAVVTVYPNKPGRYYRLAEHKDQEILQLLAENLQNRIGDNYLNYERFIPYESIPPERPSPNARGLSAVTRMGVKTFKDLYTPRQLLGLATFTRLINEVENHIKSKSDPELAIAVQTCLALNLSKLADLATSLGAWEPNVQTVQHVFGRQALPICWDFAEGNLIGESRGSWQTYLNTMVNMLPLWANLYSSGHAEQFSATENALPDNSVDYLVTDPPYYDAIPYGDLSDFFYVWLKRAVANTHSELFGDYLTPKDEEAIWNPSRTYLKSGKPKDEAFYENQIKKAFEEGRRILHSDGVGVVVFAHKTTSGWEAVLKALIDSGWVASASWPIDTELGTRVNAMQTASLSSSIHIVCRPRVANNSGDWRDILQELPHRIHHWLPRLASEGVIGADAIFACLGPALEIFSRYGCVEKASGEVVTLGEYLEQVWAAVSKEALAMVFQGADTTGFEEDARLTAMWLWTLSTASDADENSNTAKNDEEDEEAASSSKGEKSVGGYTLEYDVARKIAQGLGAYLEQLPHLIEVKGSYARLLPIDERTRYLFGQASVRTESSRKLGAQQGSLFEALPDAEAQGWTLNNDVPLKAGQTALDRVHQSMLLFAAGRSEALKRFLVDDGVGHDERFWRLSQALSALYPATSNEKRWVDGVLARKKGLGFA
jgi:adenine-specific DNA methylase